MDVDEWNRKVARAGELAGQLAQVHAELVDLTRELLDDRTWAGDGVRSPEHWLQVFTGLSPAQTRHVVRVAERAPEQPTVQRMLRAGRLSLDQAAQIAAHVPEWAEQQVAALGETLSVTQLQRAVARYPFERERPGYEEPRTPPSQAPASLTMTTSGGRFRLRFEIDAVQGALVENAIREAKDALFSGGQPDSTLADGLVEVASRSLASVAPVDRRDHYRVMVHLDAEGKGWLGKRGALPENLLQLLTCDGLVRPVHEVGGVPVSVGRSQRIVPQRTRRLIEDRDGGCRYPGCPATGFLENHHLVHWSQGGPTDMDHLISLCPFHHREHHRGTFAISGTPTRPDGLVFTTPWGSQIGKYLPQTPLPASDRPPPERQRTGHGGAVRGERLDLSAVRFSPPAPRSSVEAPAAAARESPTILLSG